MIRNTKISTRLLILIVVQVAVLVVVAVAGILSLNISSNSMLRLNQDIIDQRDISRLGETVRADLLSTVNDMSLGTITWEEGRDRLTEAKANFEEEWQRYLASLAPDEAEFVQDLHKTSLDDMREVFDELEVLYDSRDRGRLNLFITNDFSELVDPYFDALQARSGQQQVASERTFQAAQETNRLFLFGGLAISIIGALIAGLLGVIIYRSIAHPINQIADTVHKVAEGDFDVRTRVVGDDELGRIGSSIRSAIARPSICTR